MIPEVFRLKSVRKNAAKHLLSANFDRKKALSCFANFSVILI